MKKNATYIPSLRFHWLTRYYDRIVAITTREKIFKSLIVKKIAQTEGNELLDVDLPSLIVEAGIVNVYEQNTIPTILGTVRLIEAC